MPCVYHKSEINREIQYYERSHDGRTQRRTRTEPVHSSVKFAACMVEDASGSVAVDLKGAEVEGESVVNRRENEAAGLTRAVISIASGRNESRQLVYTETILAKDIPIYVLGEVQSDGTIGKPGPNSTNQVFVVSRKSEEERARDLTRARLWYLLGAIALFALAGLIGYIALRM